MENIRNTGSYEKLGNIEYFIPTPLPPKEPPLNLSSEIIEVYGEAMHGLGQLNEMAERLPDLTRFIKAYAIKEALLSSAIEGIHTTLMDVLEVPLATNKADKETQLVLNYTLALKVALDLVHTQGLPIVSRVILSAHKTLMQNGEGDKANPGQYRKQAVRVGNLIPPPASKVLDLMSDLEKFINDDNSLPPLIKAGLAHIQFETIHPFLDGNGRIGRLLIVLMLVDSGLLKAPILYPSYYFKKNHLEYYQRLDRVRTQGDFEGWIYFYLKAIKESCIDAHKRALKIEILEKELRQTILTNKPLSNMQESCLQALSILFQSPIINVTELSKRMSKSYNTTSNIISHFIDLKILENVGIKKRKKLYRFTAYINLLEDE